MNLPECGHGELFGDCKECLFEALKVSWKTNAELHRRCQANEGAAVKRADTMRQLRLLESVCGERKDQLNTLGIAWSTRGAVAREGELTKEEVERLVHTVDRIQRRHFNTEYRLLYGSVDEQVRKRTEGSVESMRKACDHNWAEMNRWKKRARTWKRLAKGHRATLAQSEDPK